MNQSGWDTSVEAVTTRFDEGANRILAKSNFSEGGITKDFPARERSKNGFCFVTEKRTELPGDSVPICTLWFQSRFKVSRSFPSQCGKTNPGWRFWNITGNWEMGNLSTLRVYFWMLIWAQIFRERPFFSDLAYTIYWGFLDDSGNSETHELILIRPFLDRFTLKMTLSPKINVYRDVFGLFRV